MKRKTKAFIVKPGVPPEAQLPPKKADPRKKADPALEECMRFEQLLSGISATFLRVPPNKLDSETERVLNQVRDFFAVDRCALLQLFPDKRCWQITHAAGGEAVPPLPRGTSLPASHTPWAFDRLSKGEVCSVSRLEELPPEAEADKHLWAGWGTRSTLSLPMFSADGAPMDHAITLHSVTRQVDWPEACFPRLRVIGEILVNALFRRKYHLMIEEHLGFERLISELSARFVNLSPDGIDGEIEDAQRHICECLDLDRSALFLLAEGDPGGMLLTNLYQQNGSPPVPGRLKATELFPWTLRKILSGQTAVVGNVTDLPPEAERDREILRLYGTRSTVVVPLVTGGGPVFGALTFAATRRERDWPETIVRGFQLIAQVLANAFARKYADEKIRAQFQEIDYLKQRLERENICLQEEIKLLAEHTEIVGRSRVMQEVLSMAEQVARTDSTVLIQGETGTGKELLARTIHNLSSRKDRALVTVNCASLPSTLIESELFGREKGAYTGALSRMIGRFELADGSTLFLDEIGELPLEVQSKLLRFLEEGSLERLGSTKVLHVNVRIIAATNRDLREDVAAGRFRKDLYYRLNVFPVLIPPLRERRDDIPLIVQAFVRKLQKRMGKGIDTIPMKTLEALQAYPWPGNVRELRNTIENAMILSVGRTLVVRLPDQGASDTDASPKLSDMERKHLVSILEKTGWRLGGKGGAAEALGLKRSTLQAKMKKLGIRRSTR